MFDSQSVFIAIASQMQAWLVGLPILAVMEEASVEATYLCRILLIWIFSMTTLVTIVLPKLYGTMKELCRPTTSETTSGRSSIYVSGINLPHGNVLNSGDTVPRLSVNTSFGTSEAAIAAQKSDEIAKPPLTGNKQDNSDRPSGNKGKAVEELVVSNGTDAGVNTPPVIQEVPPGQEEEAEA